MKAWTAAGLLAALLAGGDDLKLEHRVWSEHELGWRVAEARGVRWAIVDGISGRARAGGEKVLEAFDKETGIRAEVLRDVLVLHRSLEVKRLEPERKLAVGGDEAVRATWLLGGLKDARAWPALAKVAAGT